MNINATQVVEKMARQSNQVAVAVAAIRANTKCGRSRAPRPVVPFRGRADLAYQLERDFPEVHRKRLREPQTMPFRET